MSTFSENLKKARKAKGWSQDQLAKLISCKRSKIGSYEEGRAHPPLPMFVEIIEAFEIRDWKGFINNVNFDIDNQVIPSPPPTLIEKHFHKLEEKTRNLVKQLLSLP